MDKSVINLNNFIFNNNTIIIIIDIDNNPWFCGNQIAKIMGYSKLNKAISDHVKEKYTKPYLELQKNYSINLSLSKNIQNTTKFINETGLYQLIMKSKLPIAEKFQDWVCDQVLPSIRKYGEYKLNKKMNKLTKYCNKQLLISEEQLQIKEDELQKERELKEQKELELQKERELKEEQFLLNQQKELELQKEIKLKEDYKEYCNRIQSLEKQDIIYIITNDIDVKQNIFKLGKTKLNHLKKRLSTYNTGAVNPYYYIYYKEVYNGEQIEKKFNSLMNRYNVKINDKINKELYQLYLPDFEFYLEKVIEYNDYLSELLNKNHEIIFLNSKNKKSIVTPIKLEEEIVKNIKINDKIIKTISFEEFNKDDKIKIIEYILKNTKNNITRLDLENKLKSDYNIIINKKIPFWNLVKEINNTSNKVKVTYF